MDLSKERVEKVEMASESIERIDSEREVVNMKKVEAVLFIALEQHPSSTYHPYEQSQFQTLYTYRPNLPKASSKESD